jgi:ADP-heptose:LPS heptosyltransferase
MSGISPEPMRIVVLHAGGVGDLVLAETLFAGLRERHPHARIELLCRSDVAPVASLYARPPDAVHTFPFDPYRWDVASDLVAAEIRALGATIGQGVDRCISAELRATFLSDVLPAVLASPEASVGDTSGAPISYEVFVLMRKLGVVPNLNLRRLPRAGEDEHELDRYARLAGSDVRRYPALRDGERSAADERWLAVFPFSAKPIQRWPVERTVNAARVIAERHGARIRLVGSAQQAAALATVAAMFPEPPELLTGTSAQLPEIAATLRGAFGYAGIDTGLVHLAAAYGVPGVAVFGGGHWPAYAPWQTNATAVLAPIPCFRCDWNCAFERAFCLDGVDVETVASAFDAALSGERTPAFEVDAFSERERAILAHGAATYRKAHADRVARLAVTTRLRDIASRWTARAALNRKRARAGLGRLEGAVRSAVELLEPWKQQP